MDKYNPKFIEKKWQDFWKENSDLCRAKDNSKAEKRYILDMFPYPSGAGLHVGHVESYTATDIYSRYLRMKGFNVLHPQGFDAFGLPAENYAVKTGIHPKKTTQKAIETFKWQINSLGFSYDWSREVNSSDPDYYKWTQWFFLLLYKNGLAYKKKSKVNWCPNCQTVLANEQAEGGKCERCGTEVLQKDLEQWFFKITDFIEDKREGTRIGTSVPMAGLLSGLEKIDWPESTKLLQKNWIGRSEGAIIKFQITNDKFQINSKSQISKSKKYLEVFTTRLDTIFGCTYCVVAPEHGILKQVQDDIANYGEVEKYLEATKKKTDLERMENKDKTGVEVKGIKVINPFNGEAVPLYVADYVLSQYGTGAVMAVPAHDERDAEFAKKYNLPIKQSVTPNIKGYGKSLKTLEILNKIYKAAEEKDIKFWLLGGAACAFHAGIIYREIGDLDIIVKNNQEQKEFLKIIELLGFKKEREKKLTEKLTNYIYKNKDDIEVDIGEYVGEFGLKDQDFEESKRKLGGFNALVLSKRFHKELKKFLIEKRIKAEDIAKDKLDIEYLNGKVFIEDGVTVDSGEFSSLISEEARQKMTVWLEKNKLGEKKVNYKLRDWLVSRQRYWGAPIPIIYCEKCGTVPVPEKDLPVELPNDVDFLPTGESPLKYSKKFQNVKCSKCGGKAKRESDTMDTFVCSSWYYLRYADPKNKKEFAAKEKLEKWLPVDLYVGGAEHTVLHLLYARFFTKVLHSLGYLNFDEPFLKLRHQGTILAEDGTKMSKSKGNVINPDDVVKKFGADALRCFEMFMGPLEDAKPWQTKGIVGVYRFLEKVWKYYIEYIEYLGMYPAKGTFGEEFVLINLNKSIKKVSLDIEDLKFNTAISQLMTLFNDLKMHRNETIPPKGHAGYVFFANKKDAEKALILLSPFAPHIAEELWHKLGNKKSIFTQPWPEYDPKFIQDAEIDLVIQVNGRVRDKIRVGADIGEEEARKAALESEKIKAHLNDKKIKKVIFVKGRLINIVI